MFLFWDEDGFLRRAPSRSQLAILEAYEDGSSAHCGDRRVPSQRSDSEVRSIDILVSDQMYENESFLHRENIQIRNAKRDYRNRRSVKKRNSWLRDRGSTFSRLPIDTDEFEGFCNKPFRKVIRRLRNFHQTSIPVVSFVEMEGTVNLPRGVLLLRMEFSLGNT